MTKIIVKEFTIIFYKCNKFLNIHAGYKLTKKHDFKKISIWSKK